MNSLTMADAVGGRRVAPVLPIDLQEARDLAHLILLGRRSRRRERDRDFGRLHLGKRAAILDRHHLAESGRYSFQAARMSLRALRAGVARMIGDELVQALGVVSAHVASSRRRGRGGRDRRPDESALSSRFFLLDHRLKLDHRHVAALSKIAVLVQHIGDAPTCRLRSASGPPSTTTTPPVMYSQRWSPVPRPPRWRRNCAPRSARRRCRGNSVGPRSPRKAVLPIMIDFFGSVASRGG